MWGVSTVCGVCLVRWGGGAHLHARARGARGPSGERVVRAAVAVAEERVLREADAAVRIRRDVT
jgi:hypothetical protein